MIEHAFGIKAAKRARLDDTHLDRDCLLQFRVAAHACITH
jgi:hypothetical protein